jgi:hypothetical protein
MRILMGFVVMTTIVVGMAVIVAVDVMIRLLPLFLAAAAVWAVLRAAGRHRGRGPAEPVPRLTAHVRPWPQIGAACPLTAEPGWVIVPVLVVRVGAPAPQPVIDGEVLGEDGGWGV